MGKAKDKRKAKKRMRRQEKMAGEAFRRAHQVVATVLLARELGNIMRRGPMTEPPKPTEAPSAP